MQATPESIEQALLDVTIRLLPARLTVLEICRRIASDPEDRSEVETIKEAIRELRRYGLFRYRNDDEVVEPTLPALHAFALFAR
jgi:hypothetical protein